MADRKLTYTIGVKADTASAQKSIESIFASLKKLSTGNLSNTGIEKEFNDAANAAIVLEKHLQRALNVNTGKLDLVAFNKSIQQSGVSFQQLINQVANGGEVGKNAIVGLSRSVLEAEIPLKRSSDLINSIGKSLTKAFSWTAGLSTVKAFANTISNAHSYAQDLDKSLNSIQIVTGKSSDEMRRFAEEANEAAKALSTTTVNYTDASLIYAQQGKQLVYVWAKC